MVAMPTVWAWRLILYNRTYKMALLNLFITLLLLVVSYRFMAQFTRLCLYFFCSMNGTVKKH